MPYTESPARMPGWTLIRNSSTKSVRYRAPSGVEVGNWAYGAAFKHYQKTGIVPQEPLGTRWKAFQKNDGASYQETRENTGVHADLPIPDTDEVVTLELPDPRPTPASRSKSGLFTAREFSDGFATLLVIMTSLLAVASRLPEAQMTATEVKAISIPLANIVERSKYNKAIGAMVVGKSDYLTLGYALYVYVDRVANAARERKNANYESAGVAQPTQGYGPVGGGNGTGPGTVGLKFTPEGRRGFTGNG